MDPVNQPPGRHNSGIKWSAAAIFVLVVAGAGYAIYHASQGIPDTTTTQNLTATTTPSAADIAAEGSPAPATITSSTDLTAAEQALDSSDVDSVTSDLSQNDTDLASF